MNNLSYRQIHLDFHTSPLISDVGIKFNADEFVKTLKEAHVSSINLFAKCHHGMCYYPTKIGRMHPALKFDLLGEMLNACRRENIRAPVYFAVGWEEVSAENANWLEVSRGGILGNIKPFEDRYYKWKKLCLNKDGYKQLILSQTREIMDLYNVDGFWYDIVFQENCVCRDCLQSMKELRLDPQNDEHVRKHDFIVLQKFQKMMFDYIKKRKDDALVFFNGPWTPDGGYDIESSIIERTKYLTHMEIESLPSETWGYNHFPLHVNYFNHRPIEIVGMNGKFHTAWGDFGSIRNKEALEFECFRMIANGAKCCIGDQLHPRGKLDFVTYRRIKEIYEQIEQRESWCIDSEKISEIG